MKREDLIKGLCATLSIARIAKEKDIKQSKVIECVNSNDEEFKKLHSNYYNEFIDIFNQL